MCGSCHVLPPFPSIYEIGVEWDGVLYEGNQGHLYLVEANNNVTNEHITSMAARIERTIEFIDLCAQGKLAHTESLELQYLCTTWGTLATAERVFGVVEAPVFSKEMLASADKQGLMVFFKCGSFELQPPMSGMLRCHKTKEDVTAFARTSMTTEDVEAVLESVDLG